MRLDQRLVQDGTFESRAKAQAAIMAGTIKVDGKIITKAGHPVTPTNIVELMGLKMPYASRGGLKLVHALQSFHLEVAGKRVMDVGASTGGFTDVLLQAGAKEVLAVDVGYGQLLWRLRQDERVRVLERTNIRYLTIEQIGEPVELVTADVSFISLSKIWPAIVHLSVDTATYVVLVKPQFEAGRIRVGAKGVVRDPRVHLEVLQEVLAAMTEYGLGARQILPSPILGPEGNVEFLLEVCHGPHRLDASSLVHAVQAGQDLVVSTKPTGGGER